MQESYGIIFSENNLIIFSFGKNSISTSGTDATSWSAVTSSGGLSLPLAIANGGTGFNAVTVVPAASSWSGWDPNLNLSANNFLPLSTSTNTSGTNPTVLSVTSTQWQFFTGSTASFVVKLPVVSTLTLGTVFVIVNLATVSIAVQTSGGNVLATLSSNYLLFCRCVSTSGTGVSSWSTNISYVGAAAPLAIADGGTSVTSVTTAPTANAWAGIIFRRKIIL